MNKYFVNLYKILFELDFDGIKDFTTMPMAFGTLVWTSLFLFFSTNSLPHTGFEDVKYFFSMLIYIAGTAMVWFLTAIFFELLAKIFSQAGKIRMLLTLSAYSLLPYIFFPCVELMKRFSSVGYFFGTKIQLLLFLWVIIIYGRALAKTYDLKKSLAYLLVFIPTISCFFLVMWLIGTIFNLSYIYNV